MTPAIAKNVASQFDTFPDPVRDAITALRTLIYRVAEADPEVGLLEETLKWGQPSYLTSSSGSGTTIRIDWSDKRPDYLSMFVHCQTTLLANYRALFPDDFEYEGNRAVLVKLQQVTDRKGGQDVLAQCISMALRYHIDK